MENKWITRIYIFADLLFREVLEQRCEPDGGFYLPGLEVANQELLRVLSPGMPEPTATTELRTQWEQMQLMVMSDDVYADAPRLQKLRWLYRLDELWVLAVVLAFAHQSDPK